MATRDGGLAAVACAPSSTSLLVKGVPMTTTLETDYPFRENLHFSITVERPVTFPFYLRIPGWATGAMLQLAGGESIRPRAGEFYSIHCEWHDTTDISLNLPMRPSLRFGYKGAVTIERGPLVYSLKIGEDWRRIHADQPYRELPHADWEVYPTTPWNYALDVNGETLAEDVSFTERPLGELPFSPEGAPMSAKVRGRRVPQWTMENGLATDVPESPVVSSEPLETLMLIPYGCTNLRVTEFPVLKR